MKNPRLLHTTKTMLATVALTGLMAGSAARLQAATSGSPDQGTAIGKGQWADDTTTGTHSCAGKNSCKGQGGCKSSDAGCKGKNTCKGKGGCKTNGTV
jgi:hypothetical protein